MAGMPPGGAPAPVRKRRRDDRLRAIGDLNQAILDGIATDELFRRLAGRARTLVEADSAIIGLLRPDGQTMVLRAVAGPQAERRHPGDVVHVSDTLLADAIRTGRASVVIDTDSAGSTVEAARRREIGAAIAVPLALRGRVFGALGVARNPAQPPFRAADRALMETFGAQAAIAVEYGRARDELRRLAILAERERIAHELHEGVIQALFGVGMDLQALAVAGDDPAAAERVARVVDGLDGVIRDLRNYVFGLGPRVLADRQLTQALRDLAAESVRQYGLAPTVDVDDATAARLGGAAAADLVQIAREALSNVGRHAQATACHMSLRQEAGLAVLEVADDGGGLPAEPSADGRGLGNMRARAAALGGTLSTGTGLAGRGTTLRLTLPLRS